MSVTRINCSGCGAPLAWCQCKSIYERAIETFGLTKQQDMLIEECAELIQAILKFRRKDDQKTGENLHEEFVDVEILMAQIKPKLTQETLEHYRRIKLERLETLITEHTKQQTK